MYNTDFQCKPSERIPLSEHDALRLANKFNFDGNIGVGPVSSFGTATRNGLDSPVIESLLGRDIPHPSRPVLGPHPASCTMGRESICRG
jgi:hypothetical protein